MKFKGFDAVRVKTDCKEGIKTGKIGAVIMVFENPNEAYEVEFVDEEGITKAQCVLLPDELELL